VRRALVVLALLLLVAATPSAAAHGDAPSLKRDGTLAPGEELTMTRELHWHRLVGSIRSADLDSLVLRVERPDGTTHVAIGARGTVNTVIRCCLDAVWAEHTIVLRNNGTTAAAFRMDIALLHDDFTVLADGAEGGSGTGVLVLSGLTAAAAWRARPTGRTDTAAARQRARLSTVSITVAWVLMGALGLYGMLRYGGGPLLGSLNAFALFPLPSAFLNAHLIGMVVLFALWLTALFSWSAAQRWRAGPDRTTAALATAILVGAPLFTLLFSLEFGNPGLAAAYGLVPPAAFLIAWTVARVRNPRPAPPTE